MAVITVCDECGKQIEELGGMFSLATGRVIVDGQDVGQACDLCAEHRPDPLSSGPVQPRNCKRVSFYWPSSTYGTNEVVDAAE